jgi:hypothetical protein
MSCNDEDEEFFKEIEEYIKTLHLDNGADEETAAMLGKIGSYWNRAYIKKKRAMIMIPFRRNLDDVIEEFRLIKQIDNYEILKVLYSVIEKIIEVEENKRQLQKEFKYEISNVNGNLNLKITKHKE